MLQQTIVEALFVRQLITREHCGSEIVLQNKWMTVFHWFSVSKGFNLAFALLRPQSTVTPCRFVRNGGACSRDYKTSGPA